LEILHKTLSDFKILVYFWGSINLYRMKKIFLLSVIASMFLFGCGPDDTTTTPKEETDKLAVASVLKENKSMVVKFSGTNCPPCGTWGWQMASSLKDGVEGFGTFMTVYGQNFVAENYITGESTTLQNAWGATGYPHFGANGSVTSIDRSAGVNVAAEEQEIYDRVNAHAAADVVANTTLNYEIVDGKINMKYAVAQWADLTAPYLAIYVIEDKVEGYQAGHSEGNGALHKNVLRKELTAGEGYGSAVEGLAVGTNVTGEISIDVDSEWDASKISIVPVMYSKVVGGYSFVNASIGNKVD
jgi:hypothetical protein